METFASRTRRVFSWSAWTAQEIMATILIVLLALGVLFGITSVFGFIGLGLDLALDATVGSAELIAGAATSLWDLANAHPLVSALVVVAGYHLGKNHFKPVQWYKGHVNTIRGRRPMTITAKSTTTRDRLTRAISWVGFGVVSAFLILAGLVALSAVAVAITGASAFIGLASGPLWTAIGGVWWLITTIAVAIYTVFAFAWPVVVALAFVLGRNRWNYTKWTGGHARTFYRKIGLIKDPVFTPSENENVVPLARVAG